MWRTKIKTIGIKDTAEGIGSAYETVRLWVNEGMMPQRSSAARLLQFAKAQLEEEDFTTFRESLMTEMIAG
jgi:hypothetical protein